MSMNALVFHIGFTTKRRRPWLREEFDPFLEDVFRECLSNREATLLAFGAHDDHVHLAISVLPKYAVADVVRDLKRLSTRRLKRFREGLDDFAWQTSYWAFSVTPGHSANLIRYILGQRAHHSVDGIFELEMERLRDSSRTLAEIAEPATEVSKPTKSVPDRSG